jgi:hypothetical protein
MIAIGGGEPTLHPRFFDILQVCLRDFQYVWLATNGSQTESMLRLDNILNGEDYPECTCEEDPEQYEQYGCLCHEKMDYDSIHLDHDDGHLVVALSQDPWHDPIDPRIVRLWSSRRTGYEIRDVSQSRQGIIAQGRAKANQMGYTEGCVCNDIILKPDGTIRMCGCTRSPVIGTALDGIEDKYKKLLQDARFEETRCYKSLRR